MGVGLPKLLVCMIHIGGATYKTLGKGATQKKKEKGEEKKGGEGKERKKEKTEIKRRGRERGKKGIKMREKRERKRRERGVGRSEQSRGRVPNPWPGPAGRSPSPRRRCASLPSPHRAGRVMSCAAVGWEPAAGGHHWLRAGASPPPLVAPACPVFSAAAAAAAADPGGSRGGMQGGCGGPARGRAVPPALGPNPLICPVFNNYCPSAPGGALGGCCAPGLRQRAAARGGRGSRSPGERRVLRRWIRPERSGSAGPAPFGSSPWRGVCGGKRLLCT